MSAQGVEVEGTFRDALKLHEDKWHVRVSKDLTNREIDSSSGTSEHHDIFCLDFFQFFPQKTWKILI